MAIRSFVPGDGIQWEVISGNIRRYLGPDALIQPGERDGVQGYWITANEPLTEQMINEIQVDSQRWL